MPFCQICGTEVEEGDDFCPTCGKKTKMVAEMAFGKQLNLSRKSRIYVLLGSATMIPGIILLLKSIGTANKTNLIVPVSLITLSIVFALLGRRNTLKNLKEKNNR